VGKSVSKEGVNGDGTGTPSSKRGKSGGDARKNVESRRVQHTRLGRRKERDKVSFFWVCTDQPKRKWQGGGNRVRGSLKGWGSLENRETLHAKGLAPVVMKKVIWWGPRRLRLTRNSYTLFMKKERKVVQVSPSVKANDVRGFCVDKRNCAETYGAINKYRRKGGRTGRNGGTVKKNCRGVGEKACKEYTGKDVGKTLISTPSGTKFKFVLRVLRL